jgi:glycosyltransferase involved in cell wall biosynthesis
VSGEVRKSTQPTILFTGRIVENKNCIYLLEQISLAAERTNQHVVVIVVGSGDASRTYYRRFLEKVADVRKNPRMSIRWFDHGVDQPTLDKLFQEAWLYASASLHEGFGLPVFEAIARGTPAIYLPCGGTEVTLANCGLVPNGNDALANEISKCIESPDYLNELYRVQRAIVEEYLVPGAYSIRVLSEYLELIV